MVVIFDMDDTLYQEATYVASGFMAVARYLAPILGSSARHLHSEMIDLLDRFGRGKVFNCLLERHAKLSRQLVRECVSCYRLHEPTINLHPAAENCLRRFRHLPLYVVTDGNINAQAAKVRALDLESKVKKVFITHRYGVRHSKPSPHCFEIIQKHEDVPTSQILYVGDDPSKDFVGIKPLGFRTLRVLTGPHSVVKARPGYDADFQVKSLNQLTPELLKRIERQ
jgi:putative hydrolase of the HAD superfamily